tara:strand:- start:353 stop:490 length:138 start_codon:yes stop_codon:yes gene_type:complete
LKKKFKIEAPNDEWFWKNRHEIWRLHPDMEIKKPVHLINKEKNEK